MKRLMLTTTLVAAMSVPVLAETHGEMFRTNADPIEIHASNLIGMRIYRSEGADAEGYEGIQNDWDDIGEVNDVILSRDGNVESVLVDTGGFLGMGENQIAVNMSALRFVSDDATADDDSDYFLVLNTSREMLEQAPVYGRTAADQAAVGYATAADQTQTDMTAIETGADMTTADVANPRVPIERDGYLMAEDVDLTAERLTGAAVYDANDEWIGEVSELVLNDDGRVNSVVIDIGGFLGIGEKPVQLNLSDIDILRADDGSDIRIYVSMTESELETMPDYRG